MLMAVVAQHSQGYKQSRHNKEQYEKEQGELHNERNHLSASQTSKGQNSPSYIKRDNFPDVLSYTPDLSLLVLDATAS